MHSSRMRTACSSSCPGGVSTRRPPRAGTPPGPGIPRTRHPPEETPPGDQAPPPGSTPPLGTRHPPPVDRITDACENITLPQLRCGLKVAEFPKLALIHGILLIESELYKYTRQM